MRDGLVSKEELEQILMDQQDARQQRVSGRRLGEVLIRRGRVTPTDIAKLVAEQYELPFLDFDVADIDLRAAAVLREEDARRLSSLPVSRQADGSYLLAIADPSTVLFSEELRTLLGSMPRFAVVGPDVIERAIDHVYSQHLDPYTVTTETESADALILDFPRGGPEIVPIHDASVARGRPLLGELLVRDGFVTDAELDVALAEQRLAPSYRLGELLVERGIVSRGVVARLVAEQYELPFYDLGQVDLVPAVVALLDENVARRLSAVPMDSLADGSLQVAIADPTSAVYSDELQRELARPLSFVVASPDAIETVLDRVHGSIDRSETTASSFDDDLLEPESAVVELLDEADDELRAATEPITIVEELGWAQRLELVDEVALHDEADPAQLEDGPQPVEGWPLEDDVPETSEATVDEAVAAFELLAENAALEDVFLPDEQIEAVATEDLTDEEPVSHSLAALPDFLGWDAQPPHSDEAPGLVDEFDSELAAEPDPDVAAVEPPVETEIVADAEVDVHDPVEALATEDVDATPEPDLLTEELLDEPETEVVDEPHVDAEPEALVVEEPDWVADEIEIEPVEVELEPDEVELEPVGDVESVVGVEQAIQDAVAAGAAVLHFSPRAHDELLVRARVDGLVRTLGTASPEERDAFLAGLTGAETALVHSATTPRGEKTTIHLLNPDVPTLFDDLAEGGALASVVGFLERPHGAILFTGPGRSGVTTTLYAALAQANAADRVVVSVEDPVERHLADVDQFEVARRHGETIATSLERLRFSDPDVVLVGDLPDRAAAELALRAADGGSLVLAGLRAAGAVDALRRLANLGVAPHLVAESVSCTVSQQLLRTICPGCRETYYASDDELLSLSEGPDSGPRLLARGRGCASCDGSGFRGRAPVFEVLPVTPQIRELVADASSAKKLRRAAVAGGMRTLREEAARLCLEGRTTVAELERVLGVGR